jgi:2-haloacid dehalogenase
MLCVFDVNETLLDLAALDGFFTGLAGTPEARQEWFGLMIHSALTLTAARRYRPFGEIGAACLPPVAARHGRTVTGDQQRELGERMRRLPAHPDAAAAGLRTAFITRDGRVPLPAGPAPDLSGTSLHDIATQLACMAA